MSSALFPKLHETLATVKFRVSAEHFVGPQEPLLAPTGNHLKKADNCVEPRQAIATFAARITSSPNPIHNITPVEYAEYDELILTF